MKEIVTPREMAQMDQETIAAGTPSLKLMEKAAVACAEIVALGLTILDKVVVVCGSGNNGGDGLAIARILAAEGRPVEVLCTGQPQSMTPDSQVNYSRLLEAEITPLFFDTLTEAAAAALFKGAAVLVDAVFGNGLADRPLSEKFQRLIQGMNASGTPITAIDIPSGLRGDIGRTLGASVVAHRTIAIQYIKTGCLLNDGPDYCGEIIPVDIGITKGGICNHKCLLEGEDIHFPKPRKNNSHKYTYGAVASVAGSTGMYGAGVLCAQAAMRVGSGLVTAFIPKEGADILGTKLPPEIMVQAYGTDFFASAFENRRWNAVLFGPGVGRHHDFGPFLKYILDGQTPVIIDADGIWHLERCRQALPSHAAPLILTPHLGEFSRLTGMDAQTITQDPLIIGSRFATENNLVLVLKGYHTLIFSPEGAIWFNSTGNPGMATAGSGDVLAGMIAGFLAQGASPLEAAQTGVYYHGAAGDVYADRFNQSSLLATDLLDFLKIVLP